MGKQQVIRIAFALLTALLPAGGAWAEGSKATSLYQRLGGKESITAVVDTFVGKVGADKRINGFFASTDLAKLKMHLVNQICEASGGPCKYVEDCQVCCQPIEMGLVVDEMGAFRELLTRRGDSD